MSDEEEMLRLFVFTDDHSFDAQGDAPFNCMKCRKCDKFATHHLNYSAKADILKLMSIAASHEHTFVVDGKQYELASFGDPYNDGSRHATIRLSQQDTRSTRKSSKGDQKNANSTPAQKGRIQ